MAEDIHSPKIQSVWQDNHKYLYLNVTICIMERFSSTASKQIFLNICFLLL